ncbi:hypothetical protein K239x_13400 [Planctomycetes bacterium K23_9]|uniref:Uncharacterized protein n=1 Tax=Stieleria marina TaxID=1930275 RepID=A0A517NQK0_9BACT|nr:hypothetical protein K239x_13400 [Planctomycetes bacterium K23_9]
MNQPSSLITTITLVNLAETGWWSIYFRGSWEIWVRNPDLTRIGTSNSNFQFSNEP